MVWPATPLQPSIPDVVTPTRHTRESRRTTRSFPRARASSNVQRDVDVAGLSADCEFVTQLSAKQRRRAAVPRPPSVAIGAAQMAAAYTQQAILSLALRLPHRS